MAQMEGAVGTGGKRVTVVITPAFLARNGKSAKDDGKTTKTTGPEATNSALGQPKWKDRVPNRTLDEAWR
jgi:hypothetical protein